MELDHLHRPNSSCCSRPILRKSYEVLNTEYNYDVCSFCNKRVSYALMCEAWASREACGVFLDYKNKKWFFWQQVSNWEDVAELIVGGRQKYIGQVKEVVETIGMRHGTYADCVDSKFHSKFLNEYKRSVENPEVAKLYCR